MKIFKIVMLLLLAFLTSVPLASCAGKAGTVPEPAGTPTPAMASASETPASSLPSESSASPSAAASPGEQATSGPRPSEAPVSGYQFEDKTYSEGTITIKYPQFTGMADSNAQDKLNKRIADMALFDVGSRSDGIDFTEYELDYQIKLNTPAVVSMYFDGYANVSGAVHPSQFLRAVTLDIEKQEAVKLPDLIKIDADFVSFLLNSAYSSMSYDMTEDIQSSIKENLLSLGGDYWLDALQNAGTAGTDTSFYLTKDSLVVSVSVPHVMGDHVEIALDAQRLEKYKTDSPLWTDIG